MVKRSHTCEEGGAHLRISFWYLLMNLKNKLLKKLLKWDNKKQNNFNIYNVASLFPKKRKRKKRTCRYHYQNLDDIIYSSWDMEHKILKLVVLGHFLSFYSLKNPKNQNFEKWKNLLEISFYTSAPQMTITWCIVPEIWSVTKHKKIKFWKTEKITWRYYHFTIVYEKSWSYAILFLRYGVWQM